MSLDLIWKPGIRRSKQFGFQPKTEMSKTKAETKICEVKNQATATTWFLEGFYLVHGTARTQVKISLNSLKNNCI